MIEYTFDNYKFIVETKNANNILLSEISADHKHSIIRAIKEFIVFLHKNRIQYVTIYDIKKQDRYKHILLYIYKNANTTERWLYDMASFVYDGDNIRCKIY